MIKWNKFETGCKKDWAIFTRCISFTVMPVFLAIENFRSRSSTELKNTLTHPDKVCLSRNFGRKICWWIPSNSHKWCLISTVKLRQRLHGTGSVWNRYGMGTDKPCICTGPGGSGNNRICHLVPHGSTYEGDPTWNRTVPVSNRPRANRLDPYPSGSNPKRIWTYPIPCKRSLKI